MEMPNWAPTVPEVAAELTARTRLSNGELARNFTADTEPTGTDATKAIEKAVTLLAPRLGQVPDSMVDQAKSLACLRAACVLERAYFPEQVETNISPYARLWAEYKEGLAAWDKAARGEEPNSQSSLHSIRVGTEYPGYATGFIY